MSTWKRLEQQIVDCRRCPRLIEHCRRIATVKRRAYQEQSYWGRPVPNFGRQRVPLLIVGLAPGAHGANRTGRMFTGDRSGEWLYSAMHAAGFSSQPHSHDANDGLKLRGCTITAVCHCAPPNNKPSAEEIEYCSSFLEQTIDLCCPTVILALGGLAWKAVARQAIERNWLTRPQPKFAHAATIELDRQGTCKRWLVGSYHPSQQNTFTGKLTHRMLEELFHQISELMVVDRD